MATNAATQFITWTYQQPYKPAKAKTTKATAIDPTDAYNKFIWDLARKFTNSAEEAIAAVREMESDIKSCAENGVKVLTNEDRLVAEIAWRRLKKFLQ